MKNITIDDSVVSTGAINRCLNAIDIYFDNFPCKVTSGKRTQEDQMRIIIEKVRKHGIHKLYPEWPENEWKGVKLIVQVENQTLYWWQRGWSKLLNINDIVNPPIPAECLFDYIRPGDTINRKGRIIGVSNHLSGNAFDLSGQDLNKIRQKIEFCRHKLQTWLTGYLIEPINNAVHCDVLPL